MYIFECQIQGKMQSSTFYKALSVLVKECVKEDQVDYRYILGISVIGSFIFGKENLLEIHFLKTMSLSPLQTFLWTLLFSRVRLFAIPWMTAHQASLSFTVSWSLLKLMSNESVMPSNHFILCHPLLLLLSILPSIRVFSNELVFIVQLSHPYMTTRKTIALTRWTFVGKVMFLFFNMLSRLVIAFLPKSTYLS